MSRLFLPFHFILIVFIGIQYSYAASANSSNSFLPQDTAKSSQDSVQNKSKITPGVPSTFDWIKFLDGRELEVEVRKISDKFVFYSMPGEMETDYVDRRQVHTIFYRSGRVEIMSTKAPVEKKSKDWQQVVITTNPKDVEGMIQIEEIKVAYEATSRHHYHKPETLETSAEIQLRKNAGLNGADIVLVTKLEHYRAYGDPPRVTIWGVSYRKL